MNGLSNKTVVITGALGGIAKATIRVLDAYQMNFILLDVVDEEVESAPVQRIRGVEDVSHVGGVDLQDAEAQVPRVSA